MKTTDIYNQNETATIREYLGIEAENWKDYWAANKLLVRKVQAEAKALQCEYCLAGDFGVYCNGELIKQIEDIILFKPVDKPAVV